jgi:CheY-like chemotaxis protein
LSIKSVLIVDDAAETRLFLKSLVSSLGFTVFEAKNGPDALKILNDQSINLVLLDILMPNMDGYQILNLMNQLRETKAFKVMFITGIRGELDHNKIDSLKPDDVVHKTVDIHVLKNKVKKLISDDYLKNKPELSDLDSISSERNQSKTIEFQASIVNLPFSMEINVVKTSPMNYTFVSPVKFKFGSIISLLSSEAANLIDVPEEFQCSVKNCQELAGKFSVEFEILKPNL